MAFPTASAEHARKRQYQIHSFFQRNVSTNAGSGSSSPSHSISPLSPPLPAETQSSLLGVGMRVRKSVPEGYKTHKTMPTEPFPFPSTAPAVVEPTLRPSYNTASSRELAPFCGLHKVGGYSAQGSLAPPSSAPPAFYTGSEGDTSVPGLSLSQSSSLSTLPPFSSVPQTANKRAYDDDAEDDVDAYFDEVEAEEENVPVETRRIARLKNSPRKQVAGRLAVFNSAIGVEGDFEEAAFLAPMETPM
jgi:hypothetical protein